MADIHVGNNEDLNGAFEGDYEDDDDKNVTRCSFGLILFAYTTKSQETYSASPSN